MSALPKRYYTQEEYALLEEGADYKSQYVAGEIYAMAGVQPWHDQIAHNLNGIFYERFRGRPCRAFTSEVKVRAEAGGLWTYPDLSVLCGTPRFDKSSKPYSLLNPQGIFEILSPTTADFDRGDKFLRYQRLASLVDYVLITSKEMRAEHYARQEGGGWLYREHHEGADLLKLASVGVELPLAEIYERVTFPGPGEDV